MVPLEIEPISISFVLQLELYLTILPTMSFEEIDVEMCGYGGDSMGLTACLSPIFEFPSRKAITRVQTSPNIHNSRHSNIHISVLRDATVRWLGALVVLQVLCMLI